MRFVTQYWSCKRKTLSQKAIAYFTWMCAYIRTDIKHTEGMPVSERGIKVNIGDDGGE